jgi:hypothetical protein
MRAHRRPARAAALLLALGAVTLAGCSADTNDTAASTPGGAALNDRAAGGAAPDGSARAGGAEAAAPAAIIPDVKAQIRTVSISLRVADVPRALRSAEDLAARAGGLVAAQEVRLDPGDPAASTGQLVLRVPNEDLGALMRNLERLGAVLSTDGQTEDATARVADVEARVASQRRSLARLRKLLDRAASVDEIVRIEADVARREADLESLVAQQRALADRTAMATVTANFVGDGVKVEDDEDRKGFVAGLGAGWDAFVDSAVLALTVLGAILPFGVVVALAGLAFWLITRGRRRRQSAAARGDAIA